MERDSNLNIPDFCKGTMSHYSVCNNNPQYTELSVLLGTAVNCQGHRNETGLSMDIVMEGDNVYFISIFYFNTIRYDMIWYGMI
jgi:hypothetical protein